jgi:arylsulfatase
MYGDVMMEVDWSVGEILKTLRKNNLEKNTLVIFTSDNGPWLNFGNHAGTTGGLREGKGTSWEGGQRVPCIMKWPGVIPAGEICNKLATAMDILPTLAEITGAGLPEKKIDGISILPLLLGDRTATPRRELYYYYQVNSLEAVQKDSWKLVLPHSGRTYRGLKPGSDGWPGATGIEKIESVQLYDLRRDPGEWYDVAEMYPEKVKELEELAEKARKDLGDDITKAPGTNRRKAGFVK